MNRQIGYIPINERNLFSARAVIRHNNIVSGRLPKKPFGNLAGHLAIAGGNNFVLMGPCTLSQVISTTYNLILSSSSRYLSDLITVQRSRSLSHPHWSLFSNHQLTPVSKSQTALFGMIPHLTCGTNFLLLFMFLISSILHHHPALLRRHTLILDLLLTFLMAFVLTPSPFSEHFRP